MIYVDMANYSKKLKSNLVLDNISLAIEKGTVIGLHGRNASGKTMLLRALAGLILPTEGHVTINGITLKGKDRFPPSCGIILETIHFWPGLTAGETLEVLTSINNRATKEDISNALLRAGLDPEDKRKVRKFSLGMKQKLAIAQAIVEKPDLLLLDEPTNSLDDVARKKFQEMIAQEKARGCTVVIASHILEDLEITCDEIRKIDNGRLH